MTTSRSRTTRSIKLCFALLYMYGATTLSLFAYDPPRDHGHQHRCDPAPGSGLPATHEEPCDECTGGASPVIAANGNLILHFTDLDLNSPYLPAAVQRTYNSRDVRKGSMGTGWVSNLELKAIPVTDGQDRSVLIRWPSGHRNRYVQQPDGSYASPLGVRRKLSRQPGGNLILSEPGGETRYEFDAQGTLLRTLDRNDNAIEFAYDPSTGCLEEVTTPGGGSLAITPGANGKVATITDHTGRTVQYEYDGEGNLIAVTDPLGNTTTYEYDANDRLTGVFDPLGRQTVSVTYDAQGRVSRLIDEEGDFTYLYDQDQAPPWPSDPNLSIGATASSNSEYGSSYVASKAIDGNTGSYYLSQAWPGDAWLQIDFPAPITVEQIDLIGHSATYTTSGTISLSNGYEEPFTQTGGTDVFDIPDQEGITWVRFHATTINYYYFIVRELRVFGTAPPPGPVVKTKKINNDTAAVWGYNFDNRGVITAVFDPLGGITTRTYDANYNLVAVTDANGNTTSYTYDADGNLLTETDPLGNTTT